LVGDFREISLEFESYDLVISNPPYIPLNAIPLDPEVRDFDPALALYGGEDGLDLIREIIEHARLLLREGGMLVLEHADGQSDMVCELLLAHWQSVRAHPDSTGRFRAVSAVR
jgi:release factor glutamine methyltransferase